MENYKGYTIKLNTSCFKFSHLYVVTENEKQVIPLLFSTEAKAKDSIDLWLAKGKDSAKFLAAITPKVEVIEENEDKNLCKNLLSRFKKFA